MLSSVEPIATVLSSGSAEGRHRAHAMSNPLDREAELDTSMLEEFRSGRSEGFEKGYKEGLRAGQSLAARAGAALEAAAEEIRLRTGTDSEQLETMAIELAIELAEAILDRELEMTSSVGADAIRRALDMAVHRESIRIHLSSEDVSELGESIPTGVEIIADASVRPGTAEVHLGEGLVPLDPHAALQRVREVLS